MQSSFRLLDSLLRLPPSRRLLLIEAALGLLLARVALKWLPFRQIRWFMNRPQPQHEVAGTDRAQLRKEIAWAIERAARLLPGKTVCFPRGLTAQTMLRRRGVSTTLYYGAATLPDRGLTGHVWVQDGPTGVIGHDTMGIYRVLASYPEQRDQ